MLKVPNGENPYGYIGHYIRGNTKGDNIIQDDIIAVISIDERIERELYLYDDRIGYEWYNDWWEGEENVELLDFFFLNEAGRVRLRGEWIPIKRGERGYSSGDFRCSCCGEPNHTYKTRPNFCQECGADMRK